MEENTENINRIIRILVSVLLNVIFYSVVIVLIAFGASKVYDFSYQIYGNVSVDEKSEAKNVKFTVEKDESTSVIAQRLEEENIITNRYAFLIRLKLYGKGVCPNTYNLSTSMNYKEIIECICNTESEQMEN